MRSKNFSIICFCASCFIASFALPAIAADPEITFYGKVITDADTPLEGAYVFAELIDANAQEPTKPQRITTQSDPNGLFKIASPTQSIKITAIRKQGYHFNPKKPNQQQYTLTSKAKNPKTPAVFKINKRKPPTQAQSMHTYVAWASKTSDYTIDLTQTGFPASAGRQTIPPGTPRNLEAIKTALASKPKDKNEKEKPEKHTDIKITTSITEDKTGYTMRFETPDKDSGIIISDKALKQAPTDGYESKAEIKIDTQNDLPEIRKYLYAKARQNKIYSRIALSAKPGKKNMLVRIACLSNLDGKTTFPTAPKAKERPKTKPQQRWHQEQTRKTKSQQKREERLKKLEKN